jgi:hypothetical protein
MQVSPEGFPIPDTRFNRLGIKDTKPWNLGLHTLRNGDLKFQIHLGGFRISGSENPEHLVQESSRQVQGSSAYLMFKDFRVSASKGFQYFPQVQGFEIICSEISVPSSD